MREKDNGFGQRLRQIRKDQGLTQKEMAAKYKVGWRTLQRYEVGKGLPRVDILTLLFLEGYSISWLLTGEGEMSKFKRPADDAHFNLLRQWVLTMSEQDPGYKHWFRIEFEKRFPEFKQWKEAK